MLETLVALGLFALLATTALLLGYVQWIVLLETGAWLIAIGFGFGVFAGIIYHLALYRALAPRHALRPKWYWSAMHSHGALTEVERPWVLLWFYLFASGFTVATLGGVVLFLAILREAPLN